MQVDLDKSIPAELYQAVSEILAFVYYLERQSKGSQMVDDILAAAQSAPVFIPPPTATESPTPSPAPSS